MVHALHVLLALQFAAGLTDVQPGRLLRTEAMQEGEACGSCAAGLECKCLALNRGLKVCQRPGLLDPPRYALAWERQGLSCEARLPKGLKPIPSPPLIATGEKAIDPRSIEQPQELREWAMGPGEGFYSQYLLLHHPDDKLLGLPVLAGEDVPAQHVEKAAATLRHLLLEASISNETLADLAHAGVRILLAGDRGEEDVGDWVRHPEIRKEFTTGLGGGSPMFPSTGIKAGESQALLAEEVFHTIQYTAMKPRLVCMYHKAYKEAMELRLYTTDGSGPEIDGEPVPTVQADEYLAMAMQRWFGSSEGAKSEYKVLGNTGSSTGRASLKKLDPKAFCLLSTVFRADDDWNPEPDEEPWRSYRNQGMDIAEVESFCRPVLGELKIGCPSDDTTWPNIRPRVIP